MLINEMANILRLPYIRDNYEEILKEADISDMSHREFLESLLKEEVRVRKNNGIKRRVRNARFPYKIVLDDYKRDHLSTQIKQKVKELSTLEFLENGENIVLIGNPGTGKTALSIALGMKACQESRNVMFINIANLMIQLREAMSQNEVTQYKKKFKRYDLVILDEFGYCSFDKNSGEILFNLLSERNEKGSTIITSNLGFDRWNEVFNDQIITGAIIDRLAYKSHMIDMSGESYRILATKEWNRKNNQTP